MEKHEKFWGFKVYMPDGTTFSCGGLTLEDASDWVQKWKTKPGHKVELIDESDKARKDWAEWDKNHPEE